MCYTKFGCDDNLINVNNNNAPPEPRPQTLKATVIKYIARNHAIFKDAIPETLSQDLQDEINHEMNKTPGA